MAVADLGLSGTVLESVLIDYTLRMQFSEVYFIVVGSPFSATLAGEHISLSPEEDADEAFRPIYELVGETVQDAVADDSGTLRVRFRNGTQLEVPPDEEYEAWNVSGPNGALVVCMPGGELAIWSGDSKA
ncbi:DUF6188 family protein [Mycolicibacterium vaccae]|uniref:DUF6188 family protein n=1 Tax=Mycolicibacterium vaccae TaxID=1810 RepID=UPI003D01F2AF